MIRKKKTKLSEFIAILDEELLKHAKNVVKAHDLEEDIEIHKIDYTIRFK